MVFWGWFPHLKPKFLCAIIYHSVVKSFWDFVQSTIISKCGTLVLHINANKTRAIRFSKSLLLIFSWFYVWKFRVNVSFNIVSRRIYSDTLRAETSRYRCRISLPGKHANIARSWDLFPKYASSTHLKSKTTACIHIYFWYKYPLKQNCHIFRPIRCEEHVVWQPACHFALFHSTAWNPRWWVAYLDRQTNSMPKIRCPRNGSLDNDMILRKPCFYRLFKNETSIYDTDPGHYFCFSCQQLTTNQHEFTAHN